MKIKQYLGTDVRDALRQIRAELGADAVILSTRRLGQGVEVSAAADAATAPIPVAVALAAASPPASLVAEQLAMSGELRTLRQLLERQLAALAWNDYTRREPLLARALCELTALGVTHCSSAA